MAVTIISSSTGMPVLGVADAWLNAMHAGSVDEESYWLADIPAPMLAWLEKRTSLDDSRLESELEEAAALGQFNGYATENDSPPEDSLLKPVYGHSLDRLLEGSDYGTTRAEAGGEEWLAALGDYDE